ncbi:MAG: O-antigen ligase family protein [Phycisphaerae bacterium]|nr:O-antigen ligase family protein [Phycisphaerae bacterium]
MWPLRTMGFLGLFVTACLAAAYYPIIGLANYVAIYQMYPESHWWGLPLLPLGIRYSLWAGVSMLVGMAMCVVTGRFPENRPCLTFWEVLVAVLVLLTVISFFTTSDVVPVQTMMLDKFLKMILFVFCFVRLLTNRRSFMAVMWVFVVGSLLLGHEAYNTPSQEFVTGRLQSIGGTDFRASSGFAAHMAAMLPLIGAAFLVTRTWWLRAIPLLAGVFTFNAIVLCRTRSAFIGLIAGILTAALMVPRSWRWKIYPGLVVAVIGGYLLIDPHFVERMETMKTPESRQADAAISLRYQIWEAGLAMVADEPLGVGIGAFGFRIAEWNPALHRRAAHNTLLLCAAEIGVPGLTVYVLIILVSLLQLHMVYWRADQTDDPKGTRIWAFAVLVSLVIYVAAGQFTERFYTESMWWVLALPTCLQRITVREMYARALAGEVEGEPLCDAPATPLDDDLPATPVFAD